MDDVLDDKVSRVLVSISGSMVGTPPSDDESKSKTTLLLIDNDGVDDADTGGGKLNRIPLFNLRIDIISG